MDGKDTRVGTEKHSRGRVDKKGTFIEKRPQGKRILLSGNIREMIKNVEEQCVYLLQALYAAKWRNRRTRKTKPDNKNNLKCFNYTNIAISRIF